MIDSDEEFKVVREQLMRVENALLDLRNTVLPKNKRNYEILAEADIDMIWALRAELDQYLGLGPQPPTETLNGKNGPVETNRELAEKS